MVHMDAPIPATPEWLDLTAIAVGSGGAALLAEELREQRVDWLGVIIIGVAVGLGGGIVRDLLMGHTPVAMTTDSFLLTAAAAAFAGMLLQRLMRVPMFPTVLSVLDAAALGFFCTVGTAKALDAQLPLLPTVLLGTVTAAGGGVLRDMLLGLPVGVMYAGSLYAAAAVTGAFAFVGLDAAGAAPGWGMIACVTVTFAVRMSSVWFGLSLPEQMSLRLPSRRGGLLPRGLRLPRIRRRG